mgnify:CR=1 FL=1
MKKLLTIALLLAVAASASALDRSPRKKKRDKKAKTETVVPAPVPEAEPVPVPEPEPAPAEEPVVNDMTLGFSPEQTDSLLAAWRERQRQDAFSEFFKQYILEDSTEVADSTPDSVYSRRLLDLASPIQFPYNSIVKGYINRYTNSRYGTISRILGMSQYYFPIIEEELLREGLPVELRALPIIESALSPTAVSPMGAVGLWQFMPSTGKLYGLEVNSLIDERYDPVLATRAACRYLKDMYAIFGDWMLAIASYNCGPGNVNKAIARSGGGKTFWDIYDYLPRETRGYVPAFIGASYAYAYHKQHGIEFTEPPLPLATDTIRVTKLMHLGQVASTLDLPIEVLRQLNPQYRLDIIPATNKHYTLVLPQQYACRYIASEEEIQRKDSLFLKEYINPVNIAKKRAATSEYVTHTVKRGETLGSIARKYRVSQQTIMRDNHIRNANRLSIGQKLKIRRR